MSYWNYSLTLFLHKTNFHTNTNVRNLKGRLQSCHTYDPSRLSRVNILRVFHVGNFDVLYLTLNLTSFSCQAQNYRLKVEFTVSVSAIDPKLDKIYKIEIKLKIHKLLAVKPRVGLTARIDKEIPLAIFNSQTSYAYKVYKLV